MALIILATSATTSMPDMMTAYDRVCECICCGYKTGLELDTGLFVAVIS
jgi:hypothetical protein